MPRIDIPKPPRELFKHGLTTISQISREDQPMFGIVRFEYPPEGGIYVYKAGGDFFVMPDGNMGLKNPVYLLHPEKGFPYPEAIRDNNVAKRLFISFFEFFASPPLRPFVFLFFLLPYTAKIKIIERWIKWLTRATKLSLLPHIIEDMRYTKCARGIRQLSLLFLRNLGIHEHWCQAFSELVATLIEYDNAYRVRVQDLADETTKIRLMMQSRKEITRLIAINNEREVKNKSTAGKFSQVARVLSYVLLVPRVRRAFIAAVRDTDLALIQTDAADRYHILRMAGYNFQGRTIEDREIEYMKLHNDNPPRPIKVGAFK